jgi:hypothetical protein
MNPTATTDYEKLGVFYLGREYDGATATLKDDLVLYDAKDLTTHAVVVGMTGSGKTGLCVSLLEEAAIDGIPALVIDPKGDIGNLLLAFPDLAPGDFAPWVDPGDAKRKGISVEELAAQTAETWKKGLAGWGQDAARVAKYRDAVDVAIYTPGASSGLPLSVLRSFAPPAGDAAQDATLVRDRIGAIVGGLLGLVGVDADPLKSREYILLSAIVENAWRAGRSLDLPGLIGAVQKPGFDKVGVFDVETFYPAKERLQLAMTLNGLVASPGFAAWLEGEPLDVQRLLHTPEGKPRISILSIAHLNDAERMFFVTLVLNELVQWMRLQPGTGSLRAIFYMDEIFGYFPPSAVPPSKPPMLTLLKQARAFGLGLVLATQNPVDLDYKGLGNAGTWFVGRLQTERDKARVLEGLESALGGGYDRATLDKLMSSLGNRVFLMRNVHEDHPVLMQTRWALSYLRGPLATPEIERLMAPRRMAGRAGKAATGSPGQAQTRSGTHEAAAAAAAAAAPEPAAGGARPVLPGDLTETFMRARTAGKGALAYRPAAIGTVKLHYVDAKQKLDLWTTQVLLAPLSDDGKAALWDEAEVVADLAAATDAEPAAGAAFAELPGAALNAKTQAAWARQLAAHAYESRALEGYACDAPKAASAPGESEGDFRARLAQLARESRDAEVEKLRQKYAAKVNTLQDRMRRAHERVEREKSQVANHGVQAALSMGGAVLGALFGRKALSSANIGKGMTAARSAARAAQERADVGRAEDGVEALTQRLQALQAEIEAETARIGEAYRAEALELRAVRVAPRKSDIAVGNVGIAWRPWRTGPDGLPTPA